MPPPQKKAPFELIEGPSASAHLSKRPPPSNANGNASAVSRSPENGAASISSNNKSNGSNVGSSIHNNSNNTRAEKSASPPPSDTRVLGPTSIAYIVHSTAFVPGAAIEEHDLKHHQTFEVGASGDGIIKFHKPPKGTLPSEPGGEDDDMMSSASMLRVPDSVRGRLAGDVAEKLVNSYFEKIGPLFPVITKSEFLHLSPPPPLMLYAICGIAALSREVPKEVLGAIKVTLNSLFRDVDMLSDSNNLTVRSLLILSMHSDLHGTTAVQSGSRCWNRTGAAIRMAQDLGLHRDASGRDDVDDDAFFLEQKRRIWGCCVTADRTMSISLGHPLAIDLTDCDVRLPSPHEILRYPTDLPSDPGNDRPFGFNTEMLKLSILFGRVMKTIYSPTGLMKTTDQDIVGLLNDIDAWRDNLPSDLQFKGPGDSTPAAGILHVSYACLLHLFFRVFMRISYNCPTHLSFSLTIERMTNLIRYSREAIEWVDRNDLYLDTLQFVSYGLVFCATVQYHAWVRRGEQTALTTLARAKDCVNRFKRQGEEDRNEELSMRAKTAEVITLLHKAASGAYSNSPSSGNLNPTAGVTNRRTAETVRGLVFRPDLSRPGGGVYVATKPNLMLDDLPRGTIIMQETESGRVPTLVRTSAEGHGGWQPIAHRLDASHAMARPMDGDVGPRDESRGGPAGGTAAAAGGGGGTSGDGTGEAPGGPMSNGNLTYVAGNVWADAQGRPVDRRGSKLLTMVPFQPGQMEKQPDGTWAPAGGAVPASLMHRLSLSGGAGGGDGSASGTRTGAGAGGGAGAGSGAEVGSTDDRRVSFSTLASSLFEGGNVNPRLNDASWFAALSQFASSGNGEGQPLSMTDAYTFDGQSIAVLPPSYIYPPATDGSVQGGAGGGGQFNSAGSAGGGAGANSTLSAGAYAPNVAMGDVSMQQQQQQQQMLNAAAAAGTAGSGPSLVDPLMIDGMPGGPLDFAAWDQWFRSTGTQQQQQQQSL